MVNLKKHFIIGIIISILFFLLFSYNYENSYKKNVLENLNKDSKVLEHYIWSFDKKGALTYLNLAALYGKYKNIRIIEITDNIFIDSNFYKLKPFEKLLHKIGLLPLKKIQKTIYHNNKELARFNIEYYKTTIYTYFLYIILNVFLLIIYLFFVYLIKIKNSLKFLVKNKTKELQKREKMLLESKDKLTVTINSIGDIFISTDIKGIINYINPIGEDILGYRLNFLKGKKFENIFKFLLSENDVEQDYNLDIVLEGGSTISHEESILYKNKKNEFIHFLDKASPIYNYNKDIIGAVIILKDITKTYQLLEELRQSQKMESIGQLSGGIAHDFNNMLSGILGATEILLLEEDIPQKHKENLNIIFKSSQKASHLTRKLLDFSRKGVSYKENLNITQELNESIEFLKRSIDKKIKIVTKYNSKNNFVKIDSSQFQNAIINIALNAKDAMKTNPLIKIETHDFHVDKNFCKNSNFDITEGDYIKISIHDNGIGMSKNILDRIFEPFFTTKDVGKGTGLGLAAVYGTIREHKGFIDVKSEIDKGTSIFLYLPVINNIEEIKLTKTKALVKNKKYKGNVLLVEDEEMVRFVSMSILKKLGFKVFLAENGKEAVDIFKDKYEKISLVIMDIVMPIMDGREAFYKLKEIDNDVKVILLSGFKREASINILLEQGVKAFLQKPYTIKAFKEKINEVLEKS